MSLDTFTATLFRKTSSALIIALALMTSACDDKNQPEQNAVEPSQTNTILDNRNVNAYAQQLAEQYQTNLDNLLSAFYQAKESGDTFSFVQYRNSKWTPAYMAQKDQHAQVFAENKAFIQQHAAAPLFTLFEYQIYIGLDLKNGLLDNDEALQQQALTTAEKERQQVREIIQLLGDSH